MFTLYIGDKGEALRADPGGRRELPLFGLTSTFIQTFKDLRTAISPTRPPDEREVYALAERFNATVLEGTAMRPESIHDEPYVPKSTRAFLPEPLWGELNICSEDAFWLVAESNALRFAVSNWLSPRRNTARPREYLSPKQLFIRTTTQPPHDADPLFSSLMHSAKYDTIYTKYGPDAAAALEAWMMYLDELFRARTRQVGVELLIVMDERGQLALTHAYTSKELIPLAWAEIMWAIDSGTYAHTCDICGGVFRLRRPFTRTAYTCSPQCARKRKIERMGGPEAFRAYNREAQRRFAERRRRRKERTQNAKEKS